jgi:3',5'-cyclic AMP phosphodiesterase CpdA
LRAVIADINASEAAFTVVNGDLTSWFTREEFEMVRERLDHLDAPYHVTRGNHDRVEDAPEDYFKAVFELQSSWRSFDHQGYHFVLLDDNRLDNGLHGFPPEEFAWLQQDLESHHHMPTFIFSHRPFGAGSLVIDPRIRGRLLELLAAHSQVMAVFNGHSHKARVTRTAATGSLPFIEVPAVKEYPVGYGRVRVYEDGFMYNYMFADCPDCREWHFLTRNEYWGLGPQVLLKRVEDRNLWVGVRH